MHTWSILGRLFRKVCFTIISNIFKVYDNVEFNTMSCRVHAFLKFLSSPKLKAQVKFSDYLFSIIRPSARMSVNFSHFILISGTTGPISTKLGTNHPLVKGIF